METVVAKLFTKIYINKKASSYTHSSGLNWTVAFFNSVGLTERKPRKTIITIHPKDVQVKQTSIIEIKPRVGDPTPPKSTLKLKKKTEVNKHRDNIRTILCSSNATPIGRYGGIGYACCFCSRQFEFPHDLKTHTVKEHHELIPTLMENQMLAEFIVKLDITDLKCNLCAANIEDLAELIIHLKTAHQLNFHDDIKDHILPFKFGGELIRCVICGNEFNNFKVLLEHMNSHYRNYVCNVCGNGFVNKRILTAHGYRHNTGVFNCTYCSKVFDTKLKQGAHERAIHVLSNKRNKCGYCGERFTDYTKKNNHEVKVHGAKPVVLKCRACDKVFDNQRSLTVHKKAYHLMEKRLSK